ncbi:Ceramide synthase [Acropora cervicornis]|uniref:Ceramide synthase n=1 Tax=Acropora cervicornis TaxID=6130 RepID=A0AAD9UZZ4_ACRCE|nr:Ceramide synthase [Acropora cervicornis]
MKNAKMDGLFLFTAGLVFFPLSHVLCTYFQKFIFTHLAYVDRFSISTRFVSALQALAASAVGLKVALTSTDIMLHRQSILTQYACFGLSYFYYDVVVMFIGGYLDEKHENPQRDLHFTHVWSKLYKKKKLIILHHIFLPIFGFPAITMWRRNKGDFFLACVYMNEMSTPFLSFKAILEKDKQRQSRALRCLEPYNNSPHGRPKDRASGSSGVVHTVHGSSVGSSGRRSKSHGSRSRSSSPAQPPEWAKQLLEQQQANAAELKRLQNELASSSSKVTRKQRAPDPEFRFSGNKQQYELNRDVMEKIDEALESLDADERSAKLKEGKDLLLQRNKHILLAEKYGWDTVACYTAEPLATDSDDEKRIRKAVKECKQLRDEKKRSATAKHKAKGGVPQQFTERRVFFDRPAATPPVAGKFHSSHELEMRKSTLYLTNGVLLASVFLFCRVLIYPYMYWCYSRYAGVPFLSTPFNVPKFCNTFCLFLFSVQVYWFVIIMQGVLRFYQQPLNVAQKTTYQSEGHLNGENGFLHKNHLMTDDGKDYYEKKE